jgi:hypothetical protein
MSQNGTILLTAKLLSPPSSVPARSERAYGSKVGALDGCRRSAMDDRRVGDATPRQGSLGPQRICGRRGPSRLLGATEGFRRIPASQAPLHRPSRTGHCFVFSDRIDAVSGSISAQAVRHESGCLGQHVTLGSRSSSCPAIVHGRGKAAKLNLCSLSYLSLTLCCVTPCSELRGGHATLHYSVAGRTERGMGNVDNNDREWTASNTIRTRLRHFLTHLPNVGRTLEAYPSTYVFTDLGRKFVQGQIGPTDCKEEKECKSFDSVRACYSEGYEKRLRREGRALSRLSHCLPSRREPALP